MASGASSRRARWAPPPSAALSLGRTVRRSRRGRVLRCPWRSVPAIEVDAFLDLHDGIVDESDRGRAMATLIGVGAFQRAFRLAKVFEGGLHVGLIGAHAPGEET